ncbi:MAG: hypothetical protein V4692_11705 [Bdellovibrionota bacterium]
MSRASNSNFFARFLLAAFATLMSSFAGALTLDADFLVNGVSGGSMTLGAPAKWEFLFKDTLTGGTPHHFHVMHAKPMHLIVVSDDLSHFAHVHPDHKPHTAKPFSLIPNVASKDPDNFAVGKLIPFAGSYYLFGEVMPMNYGMLLFPYDLNVAGTKRAPVSLQVDERESDGKIAKVFDSGKLRTKLFIEPMEHCGVILPRFTIELEAFDGVQFVPVEDLEPWLESYGHAIVIGQQGVKAADKIVQHLHAVWPLPGDDISKDERGPFIELAAHSHGKSTPTDVYKAWIQMKRGGVVQTLDFTFDWNLERAKETSRSDGAFCFDADLDKKTPTGF